MKISRKSLINEWVERLRNDPPPQISNRLKENVNGIDCFCVMGVLCDILEKKKVLSSGQNGDGPQLPPNLRKSYYFSYWRRSMRYYFSANLPLSLERIIFGDKGLPKNLSKEIKELIPAGEIYENFMEVLIHLNDVRNFNFLQLADVIEEWASTLIDKEISL